MKKALILGILVALLIVPTVVFAATTIGLYTGTKITALGPNCNMNYTDASSNPKAPIYGTNITTEVTSVYGFEPIVALGDQTTQPGQQVAYFYTLTNNANTTDAMSVQYSVNWIGTPGTNWKIEVIANGSVICTAPATPGIVYLSENGAKTVSVEVTPSTFEAYSPNGSSAEVTLSITTSSLPSGYYTGANTNTYGGLASSSDATVSTITTSAMKMTRYSRVNAPILYSGGKNDPVPGAVITYVIITSNEGNSNAKNVIIVDKVPTTDVVGMHMGKTGTQLNVTIDAGAPTAYGWTGYYTTGTPANFNYGDLTGWVTVPGADAPGGDGLSSGATYMKWEKPTVEPSEDAKTLTWGVIIR